MEGKAALVYPWQCAHHFHCAWYSMISGRGCGTSMTWRRSMLWAGVLAQIGLTMLAFVDRRKRDHMIRSRRQLQRLTGMTRLASHFFVAFLAQTFRFLLTHKAIRGGRQGAIMAVFGQPILQLFDLFLQIRDGFQSTGICFTCSRSKLSSSFFGHAFTLSDLDRVGKSLGDLISY